MKSNIQKQSVQADGSDGEKMSAANTGCQTIENLRYLLDIHQRAVLDEEKASHTTATIGMMAHITTLKVRKGIAQRLGYSQEDAQKLMVDGGSQLDMTWTEVVKA